MDRVYERLKQQPHTLTDKKKSLVSPFVSESRLQAFWRYVARCDSGSYSCRNLWLAVSSCTEMRNI